MDSEAVCLKFSVSPESRFSMRAHVPQVIHLGREHCSAGISRRAWAMWLVGSMLVGDEKRHSASDGPVHIP